jgi:hypothetical protein
MKKIYFTFCALLFMGTATVAQNLVPNAGFEVQDTCPAVSEIFKAPPWVSATMGTPDLFNSTCSTQNSAARTGIGSSGVYAYSTFPDTREYMIAPLNSPMTAGTTYYVSFWVKRSNFRYAVNKFGAYFSTSNINQQTTGVLNFTPQVQNPSTTVLSSSTSWMQITGSFVAAGGESYIVFGNFSNDANTDTTVANSSSTSKVAYYKIDDVSVTASASGLNDMFSDSQVSVYPMPATSFITLRTDAGVSIDAITLYDAAGREVKSFAVEASEPGEYTLSTSECSPGIYFLAVRSGNAVMNKKVVITQ